MHCTLSFLLSLALMVGSVTAQCLRCTQDACSAALVPTPSATSLASSICASWLSVTVTPTLATATSTVYISPSTTSTTTIISSITVTSTSTATLVTGSTVSLSTTTTQVLQKRQSQSTDVGEIVPNAVPTPYAGPCADVSAFFSACICMGARATTVTASGSTQTVVTTVTGSEAISTSESLVTAATSDVTAMTTSTDLSITVTSATATTAPTGRLLVAPGSGSPVDGQYVFANSSYASQSNDTGNVAIALQFTSDRDQANLFSIDPASGALTGYQIGTYLGAQAAYNSSQDSDDFYNTYLLVPQSYLNNSDLPVPTCRNTGGLSQGLQCVETQAGDTRDVLQYCPGDQSWFGSFGYQTTGFLVLDTNVDSNCFAVNLQFENLY